MIWLKYKPDVPTFRAALQQPDFQKRVLAYLSEIIKHEAPAQWKNSDPNATQFLADAQQTLYKHFDCPHCNTNHESLVDSGAQRPTSTDQHLACKRISDPHKPDFADDVLRDLTGLVGEMVTHNEHHHTSCFKYVKRSKRGKSHSNEKNCRYHFPKELGMRILGLSLLIHKMVSERTVFR